MNRLLPRNRTLREPPPKHRPLHLSAYRLMYVAKYVEGIYVLHVFQKKSRKTAGLDLEVARGRFATIRRSRVWG